MKKVAKYSEQFNNLTGNKKYYCRESEKVRKREDGEYQRDYSRIMYSPSFRRLQGKMQMIGFSDSNFYRNRLTHSIEVAQIARSIANSIGYNNEDIYVVEAGALAHDIGNPPFGHSGEKELNSIFIDIGGFEGNAQSLRILTNVERKKDSFLGLNLTYRTLLSIVKYFRKHNENGITYNKFIYDDDYNELSKYINDNNIMIRTQDVQIIDIADEIAYAAHDLEDGLKNKFFNSDELLKYCYKEMSSYSYRKIKKIIESSKKQVNNYIEYNKLFAQEVLSLLINELIEDVDIYKIDNEYKDITGTNNSKELGFIKYGELVHKLKYIIFSLINNNDETLYYEKCGNKALDFLCSFYMSNPSLLPSEYRSKEVLKITKNNYYNDENKLQKRLVCDFVSGMMESYVIKKYEELTDKKFNCLCG